MSSSAQNLSRENSATGDHLPPSRSVPLMTREAFANAIGLPLGVVINQCDRGYWPCLKVGKYSLINVELLRQEALNQRFKIPAEA